MALRVIDAEVECLRGLGALAVRVDLCASSGAVEVCAVAEVDDDDGVVVVVNAQQDALVTSAGATWPVEVVAQGALLSRCGLWASGPARNSMAAMHDPVGEPRERAACR